MKNFFIAAISMAFVSSALAQLQPQGTWYLGTANAPEALNIFSDGLHMTPTIGYAVSDNVVLTLDFGVQSSSFDTPGLDVDTSYTYITEAVIVPAVFELQPVLDEGGLPVDLDGDMVADSAEVEVAASYAENQITDSTEVITSTDYVTTEEERTTNFTLGLQYFFDDNYFVRGSIASYTHTTTTTDNTGVTETESNSFGWSLGAGKFISVRENWYLTPELRYTGMNMGDDDSTGDLSFRVGLGLRF